MLHKFILLAFGYTEWRQCEVIPSVLVTYSFFLLFWSRASCVVIIPYFSLRHYGGGLCKYKSYIEHLFRVLLKWKLYTKYCDIHGIYFLRFFFLFLWVVICRHSWRSAFFSIRQELKKVHISTFLWSPLLSLWELRDDAVLSPPIMRVVVVQSVSISIPLIRITCNTPK